MARFAQTGDFRRSFVEGPREETLNGPYLSGIQYPDTLVARAYSNGCDLDLVLYPGNKNGLTNLLVERLTPGREYKVAGAQESVVRADSEGTVRVSTVIDGRTEVGIAPAVP